MCLAFANRFRDDFLYARRRKAVNIATPKDDGDALVLATEEGEVYRLAWDGGSLVVTRRIP